MKRKIRLVLIALLELVWVVISLGFFSIFLWGSVQSFGVLGILTGVLLGTTLVVGIAGLIFLFVEIYYTLRSIEQSIDDIIEVKNLLGKLARINYQVYEMFYEQFYGAPENSVPEADSLHSSQSTS